MFNAYVCLGVPKYGFHTIDLFMEFHRIRRVHTHQTENIEAR